MLHEISFKSFNERDEVQGWVYVPACEPKGIIQLIHGFGEHSRRYFHMIVAFMDAGFIVAADDHVGHGKTAVVNDTWGDWGNKGAHTMMEDEHILTGIVKKMYPDLPYFLFGHSMGSFIARDYIAKYGNELKGVTICGTCGALPSLQEAMAAVREAVDAGKGDESDPAFTGMLFGFQIYADFSGYSDIALGAARLLGIRLHVNFDSPYLADSIRDFWRRWHITLTNWFTDYVYIPLGGSRRGTAAHVRNILIVFLLSGFWHGADWHFAAWGLYHGVLLSCAVLWEKVRGAGAGGRRGFSAEQTTSEVVPGREALLEREVVPRRKVVSGRGPARILRTALTFLLTSLGWILFRASSIRQALSMYAGLARGWTDPGILRTALLSAGVPLGAASLVRIALVPILLYLIRTVPEKHSSAKKDGLFENNIFEIIVFLMAAAILVSWIGNLAGGTGNDFIYFRF